MKVTLDYDEQTGELFDRGSFVMNIGAGYIFSDKAKAEEGSVKTDFKALVSLKDAGFSAEEIMQMKREGLV